MYSFSLRRKSGLNLVKLCLPIIICLCNGIISALYFLISTIFFVSDNYNLDNSMEKRIIFMRKLTKKNREFLTYCSI